MGWHLYLASLIGMRFQAVAGGAQALQICRVEPPRQISRDRDNVVDERGSLDHAAGKAVPA